MIALPPKWARRVLLTPILPVVFVLLVTTLPVAVPVGAFATRYLPGRLRAFSLLWLAFIWLLRETGSVLVLFGLWLLHVAGVDFGRPWQRAQHMRIMGWYLQGLVGVATTHLGLRIVVESAPGALVVEPRTPRRPMVVASRHSGAGDSLVLLHLLVNVYGRWPSLVLKDTLQWLPSLDILLNRMGAAFVSPGSRDRVVAAIARLAGELADEGALLIFPEGGNFSQRRRERALERIAGRPDLAHLVERAHDLATVLPPRLSGVEAALGTARDADVVVVAHTGLEGYSSPAEVLARLPMQHSVRLALWHVPRASVPDADAGRSALEDWLYEWWEAIDTWVEAHDEPGVPDQRPA